MVLGRAKTFGRALQLSMPLAALACFLLVTGWYFGPPRRCKLTFAQ
jgi:hypothetical protein